MLEVKSELYVSDEVSASKLFDIDIKESDDGDSDELSQKETAAKGTLSDIHDIESTSDKMLEAKASRRCLLHI